MRILQRYVLGDLSRVFGLAISVLTMLLVVMGVASEAASKGLGVEQIVRIIPYIVPSLLPYTIPATLLLTVCIVYGRMAGDNEITAIKAAGINVLAVLIPSFVLGAVLSLGTFILTDQFIPWGRAKIENVVTQAMEDIFLDMLRSNNAYHDPAHGISILVASVEPRKSPDDRPKLIRPMFRYRLAGDEFATITAREATLQFNLQEQQVELTLHDGYVETPTGDTATFEQEKRTLPLPTPTDTLKAPRNMTIESIHREIAELVRERDELQEREMVGAVLSLTAGHFNQLVPGSQVAAGNQFIIEHAEMKRKERHNKLRTEIHGRVAMSCSCVFFVLIGSPFAIVFGRRQFLTNFALCFVPIVFGYYPIVLLTMNLCRDGLIDPAWGMWIANVGLLATAAVVLRKVLRH
ncbi:MAG TPA: LptF/LptG family permease [Planctomycetaceae bacterium]|jgi:lipopolysaccharide export system permease protein